jgi:hypothetical protein
MKRTIPAASLIPAEMYAGEWHDESGAGVLYFVNGAGRSGVMAMDRLTTHSKE